jgi:hypothetical protein
MNSRDVILVLSALLLLCAPIVSIAAASTATADDGHSAPTSANTTTVGDDSPHATGGHASHPHYALTYLVFMLFIGAVCYQFDRKIPIPYTCTLLLCGVVIGLVHESTDKGLGRLSISIDQWLSIDPHLLLFAFLPALLFGDAITMEFASISKAFGQMLILATAGACTHAVWIYVLDAQYRYFCVKSFFFPLYIPHPSHTTPPSAPPRLCHRCCAGCFPVRARADVRVRLRLGLELLHADRLHPRRYRPGSRGWVAQRSRGGAVRTSC